MVQWYVLQLVASMMVRVNSDGGVCDYEVGRYQYFTVLTTMMKECAVIDALVVSCGVDSRDGGGDWQQALVAMMMQVMAAATLVIVEYKKKLYIYVGYNGEGCNAWC